MLTVWLVQAAFDAGPGARVIAAIAWGAAFALGWFGFRRMYYRDDLPRQECEATFGSRLERWGIAGGVGVSGLLLDLGQTLQMVGLAFITGFMWPAFYWMI